MRSKLNIYLKDEFYSQSTKFLHFQKLITVSDLAHKLPCTQKVYLLKYDVITTVYFVYMPHLNIIQINIFRIILINFIDIKTLR